MSNGTKLKRKFQADQDSRKSKSLVCTTNDVDFEMKDGNTTYEVVSHFNSDGDEYFLNQIIRKLGYKYYYNNKRIHFKVLKRNKNYDTMHP